MTASFDGPVTINGVTLHARVEGREDGPVVALVNSLATDLTLWDAQIPALAGEFRVLRYDARGHGRSPATPGPYSMDMLTDDLLGLLGHVRATRAHVVGVSLGGLTAMAVALRRTPLIASVVPCDCRADMPQEFADGIDARNKLVREQGMAAVADTMVKRWFTPQTLSAGPAAVEKIRAMVAATSVEGFVGCAEAIKLSGLRPRVKEIALPAMFVVGTQDQALPVELMRAMQSEVPGAQLATIEGAGHLPNVEQPETFNAALLAFLRKVK